MSDKDRAHQQRQIDELKTQLTEARARNEELEKQIEIQGALVIAMEECMELAQRLSKAHRFTLQEIQPGQELTNAERIHYEHSDLQAALNFVEVVSDIDGLTSHNPKQHHAKITKIEKFVDFSEECWKALSNTDKGKDDG